jgi:hypothetical protein
MHPYRGDQVFMCIANNTSNAMIPITPTMSEQDHVLAVASGVGA